ncbi:response regulator [Rubrobacter marinus]|nr:response regulator transcription factor [Rubrobacter marinus]
METGRKTLRVLIVDDHAAFRQALAIVLGAQPDLEAAGLAGSLAEARGLVRSSCGHRFDAAVVDLGLPDGDGAELAAELVQAEPAVAVLALADRRDLERRGLTLRAGAKEVLTKGADLGRILDALRRLGTRRR